MGLQLIEPCFYSKTPVFGLPDGTIEEITEDLPMFYIDEVGFIQIPKAQVIQAQYHFERNLMLSGDVMTLKDFYTLLGIISHVKKCFRSKADNVGWHLGYMWDQGYSWVDFYYAVNYTRDGLRYYEFVFDPIPDDLSEIEAIYSQ